MRKVIVIDHDKCDGCGNCVSACPQGAIDIHNRRASLTNQKWCTGFGSCASVCPQQAINLVNTETYDYDEIATCDHLISVAPSLIESHLYHLYDNGMTTELEQGIQHLENCGVTCYAISQLKS